MLIVDENAFDPGAMLSAFSAGREASGAVVTFTGLCRGRLHGAAVSALHLDAYPNFTRSEIGLMVDEARARFDIDDVFVRHRHGTIAPGESIVFVAAAAAHRRAAFEAADFLMDQLKTRAPFWKRESRPTGDLWLEPKGEELVRAQRWQEAAE